MLQDPIHGPFHSGMEACPCASLCIPVSPRAAGLIHACKPPLVHNTPEKSPLKASSHPQCAMAKHRPSSVGREMG